MMALIGDGLWYEGQLIATIHEKAVLPTLLADFIDEIRKEPSEEHTYEEGLAEGHADAQEEHAPLIAAVKTFCQRCEAGEIKSTET